MSGPEHDTGRGVNLAIHRDIAGRIDFHLFRTESQLL